MKINSRTKGHSFERQICKILNKEFNIEDAKLKYKRVPMSGGFDKANFPGDIFSMDKTQILARDISIECKFYRDWKIEDLIKSTKPKIIEWWRQAVNDAEIGNKIPLLIIKKNNSDIYYIAREVHLSNIINTQYNKYIKLVDPIHSRYCDVSYMIFGLLYDLISMIKVKQEKEIK